MLGGYVQPRSSMRSDIGEAKITRTLFGAARVRVIREKDRMLRAWLLTLLALTLLALAGWQGWNARQEMQMVVPALPLSERIKVSPPVFESGDLLPDTRVSARNNAKTPAELIIDSMATHRPPAPQQPLSKTQTIAQPPANQKAIPNKANPPALATGNNALKKPALQQVTRPSVAVQPAAVRPAAMAPAMQPVQAAAVVPLAESATNVAKPAPPAAGPGEAQINARGTAIIYVDPQVKAQP